MNLGINNKEIIVITIRDDSILNRLLRQREQNRPLISAHKKSIPIVLTKALIPHIPGCYIMRIGGNVKYVGKSKNVHQRLLQHMANNGSSSYASRMIRAFYPSISVSLIPSNNDRIRTLIEKVLTNRLNPPWNSRIG
jgi:hypothetical protein